MLFPDSFTTHLPNATTSIPANSTCASSSYVAIGESITNSNLFSVNVTPPSEPTLIGGEEEKMAVEYFVVRCRYVFLWLFFSFFSEVVFVLILVLSLRVGSRKC